MSKYNNDLLFEKLKSKNKRRRRRLRLRSERMAAKIFAIKTIGELNDVVEKKQNENKRN